MEPQASMTAVDWVTAVGIPSIIVGLVYIGGRLFLLSKLDNDMKAVKNNIAAIANALTQSDIPFDHGNMQTYSPITLTEKGNAFLDTIGFKKLFRENAEDFFHCIDEEKPQTNYDIERMAIKSIYFLFDKPYFNEVKNYLYENPKENRKEAMQIAGIYVRDRYMERSSAEEG